MTVEKLTDLQDLMKRTTTKARSEYDDYRKYEERQINNIIFNNIVSSMTPTRYRKYTFGDYKISTKAQVEIVRVCKDMVFNNKYDTGIIMIGKNGTGKTMLASIILQEIIRNNPHENQGYESKKRLYTEAIKLVRKIKDTWRASVSEQSAIDCFIKPDVLVIDEMGVQYWSPTETQFITEIINDRYNEKKPTILCGNVTIKEMKELVGDRIIDRYRENGRVLVFDWNSYRGMGDKKNE